MDTKNILARARREGTPLIDGETATFVWRGKNPLQLMGDWTGWDAAPITLEPIAPNLWTHVAMFPRDTYMEYAYVRGKARTPDPLNPRVTPNGLGAINHFFYMPEGHSTSLLRRNPHLPHGTVTRHTVKSPHLVVGGRRTVHLYSPPTDEPVPLLVVFDGDDYLRRAHLPNIVDNLIAARRIQPLAMAFVDNGGEARFIEYACSESVPAFLLSAVLPLAGTHLNLVDARAYPGAYGVLGASMGGLIALYTALRFPGIFGRVASQSGAFSLGDIDTPVYALVYAELAQSLHLWLDWGSFEDLLETNQRMCALLGEKGVDVTCHEYHGGHNYPSWRDDIERGLECLFPL